MLMLIALIVMQILCSLCQFLDQPETKDVLSE